MHVQDGNAPSKEGKIYTRYAPNSQFVSLCVDVFRLVCVIPGASSAVIVWSDDYALFRQLVYGNCALGVCGWAKCW
jgi:hypothetical protein